MKKESGAEIKMISLQKGDIMRILKDHHENRINIVENPEHEGGVLILAGKSVYREMKKIHEAETKWGGKKKLEGNDEKNNTVDGDAGSGAGNTARADAE